MSNLSDEVKRLRGLRVSVQDVMRQTGLSMFEVSEFSEGREIAVHKMARLHFVRGTGWPWDEMASDPDNQHQPTGDYALDAVRAIINLMSGTKLDDPVRQQLNEMTEPECCPSKFGRVEPMPFDDGPDQPIRPQAPSLRR
ncbi:hypothetical protein [Rhizobium leguminosarum]|uniref:hypothetical protein n=1 Tax=Rhizobium leguminosarum TaxID=384 RepID=UPI001441E173|nr:hypothetical protein [Rhizobium leguminosarum]MBY5864271.1 hypothetical protein [Rhizobium leguminosarum]NKM03288.1 hypothetical protein [Rhizobium leguminosarum bv. viciae]